MRISVIGMGKLGCVMAALYASRGHEVIGIDANQDFVNKINKGIAPVQETGLQGLLSSLLDKSLIATTDYEDVASTDITFIIVPTPSGGDDRFINDYIISCLQSMIPHLKDKQDCHLIVITSTVMPGSCQNVFVPMLEEGLGRKVNDGWGICYNPEFIALGSVIRDMENPDAILIGESDKKAGDMLGSFYYIFHSDKDRIPPIRRMSLWEAEVAKITLNCCLTNKISLANSIARVCEMGGDASKVLGFVGLDSRIGPKFMGSGLGYAGPCLPRDCKAFISFAGDANTLPQQAADKINDSQVGFALSKIRELLGKSGDIVAILGVTYKTNTPLVIESRAVMLARQLIKTGIKVRLHDPQGLMEADKELGVSVKYCDKVEECLAGADLCVIGMGWDEYKAIRPAIFKKWMKSPVIYDCWRIYDKAQFVNTGVEYYALGVVDDKSSGDRGQWVSGAARR